MFATKLGLIAAAVAVALGHAAAAQETTFLTVHTVDGETTVKLQPSLEDYVYDASGSEGLQPGEDEDPEPSSSSDSASGSGDRGSYPDHDGSSSTATAEEPGGDETVDLCLSGWTQAHVIGMEHAFFCVDGTPCGGNVIGVCPWAQEGLPFGSFCDAVSPGVVGCRPGTDPSLGGGSASSSSSSSGDGSHAWSGDDEEGEGSHAWSAEGEGSHSWSGEGEGSHTWSGEGEDEEGEGEGSYGWGDDAVTSPPDDDSHGSGDDTLTAPPKADGSHPWDGDNTDTPSPRPPAGTPPDEDTPSPRPQAGTPPEGTGDSDGSSDDTICSGEGISAMSVEGVEGIFCVTGQPCVATFKGSCPVAQDGLEYGSYCGTVLSGVFGCKPMTKEMYDNDQIPDDDSSEDTVSGSGSDSDDSDEGSDSDSDSEVIVICRGLGEFPMSVEGVEGTFCVGGQSCVDDIMGECPGPQSGLEFGAYCGTVASGVLGCKAYTEEQPTVAPFCSGEGDSQMSVEGVEGIFCVNGQPCVADIDGACPGPQEGLEFGAYCGTVASGVQGCKANTSMVIKKKKMLRSENNQHVDAKTHHKSKTHNKH